MNYQNHLGIVALSPFELEGVMAVSKGAKTRSSQKTVLPIDADRTMVVLSFVKNRFLLP